jgi:hypothetical protein
MQNMPKNAEIYVCEVCDFKCSKFSNWSKHELTRKHLYRTNLNSLEQQKSDDKLYSCKYCDKQYKARNSLWYHEHKCCSTNIVNEEPTEKTADNQDLIAYLMKQNSELQHQIIEVCKNSMVNNTTNNVNSHNKTFNLQVFLNEDCKDAMNITEFVDSIKFQLADLEHMGQVGYVDGISNIILKNLKALDVTKRPVHCTDQKRETIYIKDGGVWSKEDEDNKNVRKLIKKVAFRNSKCLSLFKEKYPDCITSESKYSDTYSKIVIEAMGGGSKCNDYDSENKIIRKIAKQITIDKSVY